MKIAEATIEEFEQGTWIADLVSVDQFSGSFDFAGETWTGYKFSERLEFERYHTRVIGGGGGLAKAIEYKFYSGNVSLQAAAQDVCRDCGETFGAAQVGVFLSTLERLRGPARGGLDAIATAMQVVWWIGRDGKLNMKTARDPGSTAKGSRVSSDVDSVLLVEPEALTLGATYGDDAKVVRHIRWRLTAKRFEARAYFVPFIFRAPPDTRYHARYSARVDTDNGDGTIDVIADGKFGVTKVPLLCGVPHSKVKVDAGDVVTLGFHGGDPQKPYAEAMAQDTTATKQVARNGDAVKVTITLAQLTALAASFVSPAGPCVYTPAGPPPIPPAVSPGLDVTGTVTHGSDRLKVGD